MNFQVIKKTKRTGKKILKVARKKTSIHPTPKYLIGKIPIKKKSPRAEAQHLKAISPNKASKDQMECNSTPEKA